MSSSNYLQLFHYPSRTAWFYDDFLGDSLKEWWTTYFWNGSWLMVDQWSSGVVRGTANAVINANVNIYWNNIRSLAVSKQVAMESRVTISASTNLNAFIGLRFDINNRLGFYFNSAVSANWYVYTNAAGVSTSLNSGVPLDASFHIYHIQTHTLGGNHVHFFIDGVETANSPISTNVYTGWMQPYLYILTLTASQKQIGIDYVAISELR